MGVHVSAFFVDIFEKGENPKNRRQYCIFGLFLAFPVASRRPFWAPFRHNCGAFFDVLFLKPFGATLEPILGPFWSPSWGHFGGQIGVISACFSILGKSSKQGAKKSPEEPQHKPGLTYEREARFDGEKKHYQQIIEKHADCKHEARHGSRLGA